MGVGEGVVASRAADGAALHPNDGSHTWPVGSTVRECLGNVEVNV